ncbi:MAG: class IV adenylate cyclase [bacterium]
MQKEVEIKIRINSEQEILLKNWLSNNSKFIGDFKVIDYYLNNPKSSFYKISSQGYKEALNFLRVRNSDNGNFVTFKNREIDENSKTIAVSEVETKIEDINCVLDIFRNLDFSEIVEIQKQRSIYMYDIFEFSFDNVQGLEDFFEIELKNYNGDVKNGIQKIYDLLKLIGINTFIQYDRGYITMILNPDYNFGQDVKI